MGEGGGEGEELNNFMRLFIPLPFIPSHEGRGNFNFYEIINMEVKNKEFAFLGRGFWSPLFQICLGSSCLSIPFSLC
jgi:hypothetical protein